MSSLYTALAAGLADDPAVPVYWAPTSIPRTGWRQCDLPANRKCGVFPGHQEPRVNVNEAVLSGHEDAVGSCLMTMPRESRSQALGRELEAEAEELGGSRRGWRGRALTPQARPRFG